LHHPQPLSVEDATKGDAYNCFTSDTLLSYRLIL